MRDPLIMACLSDISGLVRGKGFALSDLEKRCRTGVGWTPTNIQITCFDGIAPSPYGSTGDLILRPDTDAMFIADIPNAATLRMVLGDVADREGTPWEGCLRGHLRAAIQRLQGASGLVAMASFEHEFTLTGLDGGPGFSLRGFHAAQAFSETLMAALTQAGIPPDSFLREFGPSQFEITVPPQPALRAADEAIALREIIRAVARSFGMDASFAPVKDPDNVGNGVHIHLSFWDRNRLPQTYNAQGVAGLSDYAGAAAAGIVRHLPDFLALTSSSALSFIRLQPHRWSAAFANLAVQDREASLRVCPVSATQESDIARQYNYEYRAADATSSPWLALSALIHAAASGIEENLPCPQPTQGDLSELADHQLDALGIVPLPRSPQAALDRLASSDALKDWYSESFIRLYVDHKRHEFAVCESLTESELITRYGSVY